MPEKKPDDAVPSADVPVQSGSGRGPVSGEGGTSRAVAGGEGGTESIESLFAAQESALLLYAQKLVHYDTETAEDIVQEAFMRLHACFHSVQQPKAWLYRTVHNLAMNHVRAGRKIVPLTENPESESSDARPLPDEYLVRLEAIDQTRQCLNELDARTRELVRLKFEEGLSYKEISARTNLSISNVGYLLHHAMKKLADALERAGVKL